MENNYNYTGYNSNLKEKARALRKNMTWFEKMLWYRFLRNHPMKFYRQRVIGTYIADFYCSKARLVIELDGNHHNDFDISQNDDIRSEVLRSYGLQIIRFSNYEIKNNFDTVCKIIDNKLYNLNE